MAKKKTNTRNRGFDSFYTMMGSKTKYIKSCENCAYHDETCSNSNVTDYDMVNVEGRVYCSYWISPTLMKKMEGE